VSGHVIYEKSEYELFISLAAINDNEGVLQDLGVAFRRFEDTDRQGYLPPVKI
jgi:hypothetical protein